MAHFLLRYRYVDDYPEARIPYRGEHLAAAQAAADRGELWLAGPSTQPPWTATLHFETDGIEAVEAFVASDPYVLHGIVTEHEITTWNPVVGKHLER